MTLRWIPRGILLGVLAIAVFGPLVNMLLWAVAERWYFPAKLPIEYGFTYWERVFRPRSNAMESLFNSVEPSVNSVEASVKASCGVLKIALHRSDKFEQSGQGRLCSLAVLRQRLSWLVGFHVNAPQ